MRKKMLSGLRAIAGTRRRQLLLLLGTFLVLGGSALAYATVQAAAPSSELAYTSAAARLGPNSWRVHVDACHSPAIEDRGASTKVEWTFSGNGLSAPIHASGTCRLDQPVPALGNYTVTAR